MDFPNGRAERLLSSKNECGAADNSTHAHMKIHAGDKAHLIQVNDHENIYTAPSENFDLPNFTQS